MPLEVRAATDDDVAAIVEAIARQPLLARYGLQPDGLERALRGALERGEGLLVAVEPGAAGVRGMAWFLERGTFAAGGYLRLIALRPGQERGGVGALLLDEVERRVAAAGSRTLFLLVSDFNQEAQRFYLRRGYQEAGRLAAFVLPDVDERILWRRL